jgi:5-hydroxyisourate hydrolase
MSLSTHVLDATSGRPAAGVPVRLSRVDGVEVGSGVTDADGRFRFASGVLTTGGYRLRFDTGAWFGDRPAFYPEVVVTFTVTDPAAHHHVPLLLSPYAYSTYRGS